MAWVGGCVFGCRVLIKLKLSREIIAMKLNQMHVSLAFFFFFLFFVSNRSKRSNVCLPFSREPTVVHVINIQRLLLHKYDSAFCLFMLRAM